MELSRRVRAVCDLDVAEMRERARKDWGAGFSLPRFHRALLDLGSPALGLLGTAVDRG
jgi:uncharacterized protein (DUF885 family)